MPHHWRTTIHLSWCLRRSALIFASLYARGCSFFTCFTVMICLPTLMLSPLPQSLIVDFPCVGDIPLTCVFWSRFRSQLFLKFVLSFVLGSASRFTCRGPVILLWLLNYLYSIFSFKHDNGGFMFLCTSHGYVPSSPSSLSLAGLFGQCSTMLCKHAASLG